MGVALTTWEVMDDRAHMLGVLAEVFAEVGADHALIGGIAVGYHGRLRATVDVDVLVPARKLARITKALEARGYTIARHQGMSRVFAPGASPERDDPVADLVEREANPVLRQAAKATEDAVVLGHAVKIVSRGALVALKFQAAVSPTRAIGDRYQDVADIDRIIKKAFSDQDEALALHIADQMHSGARQELEQLLTDLRAGRPVRI